MNDKSNKLFQDTFGLDMRSFDFLAPFVAKFFGMLFVIILPIRPALIAVGLLVLADFVTGLWASFKEGKKITSSGLRRTIIKTLAYQSSILIGFIIQTYLLDDIPVVKVITGLIAVTESKSFFENMRRITGIDFWTEILSKLNMPDNKIKADDEESK